MPYTPDEIAGKRFLVTLRGYDRSEVDAYIRALAREQAKLLKRIEELEAGDRGRSRSGPPEPDRQVTDALEEAAATIGSLRRSVKSRGRRASGDRHTSPNEASGRSD